MSKKHTSQEQSVIFNTHAHWDNFFYVPFLFLFKRFMIETKKMTWKLRKQKKCASFLLFQLEPIDYCESLFPFVLLFVALICFFLSFFLPPPLLIIIFGVFAFAKTASVLHANCIMRFISDWKFQIRRRWKQLYFFAETRQKKVEFFFHQKICFKQPNGKVLNFCPRGEMRCLFCSVLFVALMMISKCIFFSVYPFACVSRHKRHTQWQLSSSSQTAQLYFIWDN